jgi:UTP--glucose-1-phosphate uridylyltransferase
MDDRTRLITDKMAANGQSQTFIDDFLDRVKQVLDGETGIVNWSSVGDLDPEKDEIDHEEIKKKYPFDPALLGKLAVIKLNGGLGTSMGLSSAKSLIEIKSKRSFLNVIASQILYIRNKYKIDVPLFLMDSYNTQEDCQNELQKIGFKQVYPSTFLQHKAPRLKKSDLTPIELKDKKEEWCPPGHGDIYLTLLETGLLDQLIEKGYEVAFISNGDNLGATVDPSIVSFMIKEELDFAMEMTPKTLADKKGGAIYRKLVQGKFQHFELLETAQVPPENEHEFSGLGKFRTFSTNNLWINLRSLKARLSKGIMRLSLIVNPKKVDGIDVLQLETAMGSAIGNFGKVKGIIISRDRFAPVKKTEDYLVRRSDAYVLNDDFSLSMNPLRKELGMSEPVATLDEKYYKKIKDFDALFPIYPSLWKAEEFEVQGNVLFDKRVFIEGKVKIINKSSELIKISSLERDSFENETVLLG